MNRIIHRGTAAATSLGVAAAGLVALGVTTAAPARAAEVAVTDATFTWDLNDEATSGAFAPGTWNLMSAGRVGDPGAGGQTLTTADSGATWGNGAAAGWSASSGDVTVEDLQADGSYAPATFASTRTNSAGSNANTNGVRGETRLVFAEGTGTMDPEAGTASIAWDGDATLLFYSGMTFFYLSDPELTVTADGEGTVTATAGGFATSMDDPTVWEPLTDTEVTVATLSGVEVTDTGIETTPEYREVPYDAGDGPAQVTTGANWGAFPTSFVDFQQQVGQAPYWYSTGGAADPRKIANPLEVSFGAAPATPQVTVSDTDVLPSGAHEVTVEGTGFDPAAVTGTRPPLAGRSGGVYVVFGKFADTWRPSQGAPSASRRNTSQQWAVAAEDMDTIGGPPAAIELTDAGTFTATLTVDKAAIDAAATDPSLVNYGIYTYPGSGAVNAAFETATPITFTRATPAVTVTAPATRFGQPASAVVRVESEGDTAGSVTLRRGPTTVGTADVVEGRATFALGRQRAGSYPLTATFSGNAATATGTASATQRVTRATTTTRAQVAVRPTARTKGRLAVTVSSPTTTPTGKVTVVVKKGAKVVARVKASLKNGKASARLPKAEGRHTVTTTYAGTANVIASKRTSVFRGGPR